MSAMFLSICLHASSLSFLRLAPTFLHVTKPKALSKHSNLDVWIDVWVDVINLSKTPQKLVSDSDYQQNWCNDLS